MKRMTLLAMTAVLSAAVLSSCVTPSVKKDKEGRSVYSSSEEIEKKSYIEGTIRDYTTEKPVEGAVVEIKNASRGVGYYKTETDSSGKYRIEDFIRNIKYEISVSSKGYVTYSSTANIAGVKKDVKLIKESIVAGTVKDSRGMPMSGVEVKLKKYQGYYDSSIERPLFTKTDSSGKYRFGKLITGSYLVEFSKAGYISESARLKRIKKSEKFTLSMKMYRPATISGKVKIKGLGSPAFNINVNAKGRYNHSNITYQDGSFIIEDVKPGRYYITLTHQGFKTIKAGYVTLQEGQNKKNLTYTIETKSPQVKIHSYRYTFTPGNALEFNFRTLRLDTVHVKVYSVPMKVFLEEKNDPEAINPEKEKFRKVTEWDEAVKNFKPHEWMYYAVKINKSLPTGGYCIEAAGKGGALTRQFFTVTNLGVVLKRSPNKIYAYVTDLVKNSPVKNASVLLYSHNSKYKYTKGKKIRQTERPGRLEDLPLKVLAKGKTDGKGIYKTALPADKRMSLLVMNTDGSYAICNAGAPGHYKSEKDKLFIYTDRPVYRSGDTVFFKIIGKTRKERFEAIKNRTIYYRAGRGYSAKNSVQGKLKLDQWGTAHGRIKLPADSKLGTFYVRAGFSPQTLYGSGSFIVEQYRKPEFKVEIKPSKDYFINGDTAEFKVETKYFFGAPLKNAIVKYRFYEKKLNDRDSQYWWEEGYRPGTSYSRIKLEGEKIADANGTAILKLASGTYPFDREITLEATVTDRSNISITSRKTVRVGRGEFYIKIEPAQEFYNADSKKKVIIRTITHSGKPYRTNLKIELFRYLWKPVQRVYVHDSRAIFSKKISTDENGRAELMLPESFSTYGEFDIIATGTDARDNKINGSRVVLIYRSNGGRIASRFKNLELVSDKKKLSDSGKITCLVKSRFTDSYVWLTLEGRDIYQSRVVKMTDNIMPVTFNINKKHAPNLYIRAAMQRKRALYTAVNEVAIPVKDVKIRLTLKTDKKEYKPGERATVEINSTDLRGKPVPADISLAAVDDSIFYIRSDRTPEISGFFYSKISNWVLTTYSYPITLLAGAGKDSPVKVREDFKDTAFWKSDIRTDKSGRASVSFTMPDNLTTWRLTARGHDLSGRMGESRKKFLSTQDLIARVGKPRFMVEGDTVNLIGIVNNNTDSGIKKIFTEMKVGSKTVKPGKDYAISLPEYGSSRKFYKYKVPSGKNRLSIDFSALAGSKSGDAVRHLLPVEKRGLKYNITGSGDLNKNRTISLKSLKNTDDFEFIPEEIEITVNPSPVLQMIRAAKYLNQYPYGCLEQTINKFIPALSLKSLLSQRSYSGLVSEKMKKDLDKNINTAAEKIYAAQNYDGTWGWWDGDRGNAFITGFALNSLYLIRSQNQNFNTYKIKNALSAVDRMLKSGNVTGSDELSCLLHAYTNWSKWNHELFKQLSGDKNINSYTAANLLKAGTNALNKVKLKDYQEEEIKKINSQLVKRIQSLTGSDSKGIYWPSAPGQEWGWPGGRTEITAHVLSALAESGRGTSLQSRAVVSLSRRFKGEAWNSTKESGTVMLALCEYLSKNRIEFQSSGNIDFALNGKKITSINYDLKSPNSLTSLTKKIKLEGSEKYDSFNLAASGVSAGDATYAAVVRGTLYFKPGGIFAFMKSQKRGIKSLSNGLAARRDLFYLSRVKDVNMQEYLVPQSISERNKISVGDEILVKVKFRASDNFGFLMLEDFLPSGFEVIKENAYNGYSGHSHLERRDNRMVFFFTDVKKGKEYEAAYIIRAELPGSYMMRPSRVECMYESTIQGWSIPVIIDVSKEK